jgi:hypothetical protein
MYKDISTVIRKFNRFEYLLRVFSGAAFTIRGRWFEWHAASITESRIEWRKRGREGYNEVSDG